MSDPGRVITKDLDFLRSVHERCEALRGDLRPCEWTFDTTATAPTEIVRTLHSSILDPQAERIRH